MRAYEESEQLNEAIAIRRRMGWGGPSAEELEAALRKRGLVGTGWHLRYRGCVGGVPARRGQMKWPGYALIGGAGSRHWIGSGRRLKKEIPGQCT